MACAMPSNILYINIIIVGSFPITVVVVIPRCINFIIFEMGWFKL